MLKKIGHGLLMVLLSPFMLMVGIGLACFAFIGWAGKDVKNRDPKFQWVVFIAPGLVGWALIIAQAGYDWHPDVWIGWTIRVSYGLIAIYALFSLEQAKEIIRRQFPSLTKTQEKLATCVLIVINIPVIFTVLGDITSRYE